MPDRDSLGPSISINDTDDDRDHGPERHDPGGRPEHHHGNTVPSTATGNTVPDNTVAGTVADTVPGNTVANSVPGDISGPCDEAEHANDPRCTGAATGDDDSSGHRAATTMRATIPGTTAVATTPATTAAVTTTPGMAAATTDRPIHVRTAPGRRGRTTRCGLVGRSPQQTADT